ncbi:MAG: 5'-nucleotidase C-terminal domain-containing protein [Dehalococcoidia bacterium]|nr:5'-nucleotidase C-terminal domain-containing protein [Dehalococcoidia bacterium]
MAIRPVVAILSCVVLLVAVAACGSEDPAPALPATPAPADQVAAPTTTPVPPTPTTGPTETPTPPSATAEPTTRPVLIAPITEPTATSVPPTHTSIATVTPESPTPLPVPSATPQPPTATPVHPTPTPPPPPPTPAAPNLPPALPVPAFTLTILHNNDAESQLIADGDFGGVARFASLAAALKSDALSKSDGVLVLSAGDNSLSGPQYRASLDRGELPYYDALAMELIGYNASAIGNHELDFGTDVFADFVESFETDIPFLSANLDVSGVPRLAELADAGRIAPSVVLDVGVDRVGLVGVTTPDIGFISNTGGIVVNPDVLSAVRSEVASMVSEGVNKIVLISHLQSMEGDMALISALSDVDAVVSAGGRYLLANSDDVLIPGDEESIFGTYPIFTKDSVGVSVPIVTVPAGYTYLGRLSLTFNESGQVLWVDKISGVARVAGGSNFDAVQPHRAVQSQVGGPVRDYVAGLSDTRVGEVQVRLDSQYPDMRTIETNEGNLIADALLWQAEQTVPDVTTSAPTVAIFNGGGIGNISIATPGFITELDLFSLLRFPDLMVVVRGLSPSDFKDVLENAVSRVETSSGRFPHGSGYSVVYDPNAEPRVVGEDDDLVSEGRRVIEVTLADGIPVVRDGAVVDGAPDVNIVTNRFLASGGDQYPLVGFETTPVGVFTHDALANYIREALGGVITERQYLEAGEGRITTP